MLAAEAVVCCSLIAISSAAARMLYSEACMPLQKARNPASIRARAPEQGAWAHFACTQRSLRTNRFLRLTCRAANSMHRLTEKGIAAFRTAQHLKFVKHSCLVYEANFINTHYAFPGTASMAAILSWNESSRKSLHCICPCHAAGHADCKCRLPWQVLCLIISQA